MSEPRNRSRIRFVLQLALSLLLLGGGPPVFLRGAGPAVYPAGQEPAVQASSDADEQKALDEAFRTAENNPQILVKNLEDFLERFPKSGRREIVLRTICTYAMQANMPEVAAHYGEILVEITPNDPRLLEILIGVLATQKDEKSCGLGLEYSTRLISIAEKMRDQSAISGDSTNTPEQWAEHIASIYAQRAGFYLASGDLNKATADYDRSFEIYPTARVAEQLGDAASRKPDLARAVDYYATAFAFPEKSPDPAHRQEVRRKLGSSYVALHHSEKGLGELVLARYDALMQEFAGRFSRDQLQNAGRHDPFEFVLERMDGSPLPFSDYRGKVIVVDFWATWCGPCRLQGKLIEQVAESFRSNPSATFLSLNTDHDRSGVPAFLKQEGWTVPEAYAQGLDQLLGVRELPTLVIFDRQGRIAYRQDGLNPGSFVAELSKHLHETLQEPAGGKH